MLTNNFEEYKRTFLEYKRLYDDEEKWRKKEMARSKEENEKRIERELFLPKMFRTIDD